MLRLHKAVVNRNLEKARALIRDGADVNAAVGRDGYTPIFEAVHRYINAVQNGGMDWCIWPRARVGYIDMVDLLLDHGANINIVDNRGITPLRLSIHLKCLPVVEALLQRGADINTRDHDNISPLGRAVSRGDIMIVRALIAHGADIHEICRSGRTHLFYALSVAESPAMVRELLLHDINVNHADVNGRTAIYWSISNGTYTTVQELLRYGADVNHVDHIGQTPLFEAVRNGHTGIVLDLLWHGADVNAVDHRGQTPIFTAIYTHLYKVGSMMQELFRYGAVINHVDHAGRTPYYYTLRGRGSWIYRTEVNAELGSDIRRMMEERRAVEKACDAAGIYHDLARFIGSFVHL